MTPRESDSHLIQDRDFRLAVNRVVNRAESEKLDSIKETYVDELSSITSPAFCSPRQQSADDVMLDSSSIVTEIVWHGFNLLTGSGSGGVFPIGSPASDFQVRLFDFDPMALDIDGNLGAPAPTLYDEFVGAVTGVDTGLNANGGKTNIDILEYSVDIPDVTLDGGKEYWLMIATTDPTV